MNHILLLGAGRSSVYLIDYLCEQAADQIWHLTIADLQTNHLQEKFVQSEQVTLVNVDIHNQEQIRNLIRQANLVISLLPPAFHLTVAQKCLELSRHLITASYVTPELKMLHQAAHEKGLIFLMECGLDPGLDHMSAKAAISQINQRGGELYSFKSYTGGLVAPESDTNPWHYKISWNPRNVVLAGQGVAKYLDDSTLKYIPYQQLFRRTEMLNVLEIGALEGYANRDSDSYREVYNLPNIKTLLRGTLRYPGFCQAWQQLVSLGLTDDSYRISESNSLTYAQWVQAYLPKPEPPGSSLEDQVAAYLNLNVNSTELNAIKYLGLFDEDKIGIENATPAQILEQRLVQKLRLEPADKDLIVMQHEFKFILKEQHFRQTASLVVAGENATFTAMAKTVGLPVAIAAKLILQGKFAHTGVEIPVYPELYGPILEELKKYHINFVEEEESLYKAR